MTSESIKVMKTDVPFVADKLQKQKKEIWNEALTFLGINNANTDKKERLVTDEVNANNEVVSLFLNIRLSSRQKACDIINEYFGFTGDNKISVKVRDCFMISEDKKDEEKEGDEDGGIHTGTTGDSGK